MTFTSTGERKQLKLNIPSKPRSVCERLLQPVSRSRHSQRLKPSSIISCSSVVRHTLLFWSTETRCVCVGVAGTLNLWTLGSCRSPLQLLVGGPVRQVSGVNVRSFAAGHTHPEHTHDSRQIGMQMGLKQSNVCTNENQIALNLLFII